MKETPQEYTVRILANVTGQDPLKVEAGTAKKLDRLIKGVHASKLRRRPAPGKWSVAEILLISPIQKLPGAGGYGRFLARPER